MNTDDRNPAQANATFTYRSDWKPAKEEAAARNGIVTAMQSFAAEWGWRS